MKCRIAFIAKPKPELIDHLESIGSDLGDYFLQNHIVELLGPFDDEEQLFDHWWYFEDVDCSQIATTWK